MDVAFEVLFVFGEPNRPSEEPVPKRYPIVRPRMAEAVAMERVVGDSVIARRCDGGRNGGGGGGSDGG